MTEKLHDEELVANLRHLGTFSAVKAAAEIERLSGLLAEAQRGDVVEVECTVNGCPWWDDQWGLPDDQCCGHPKNETHRNADCSLLRAPTRVVRVER